MKVRMLLYLVLLAIYSSVISVCLVVQASESIPLKFSVENAQEFKDWKIQAIDVLPATGSKQFNYVVRINFENLKVDNNNFVIDPTKILMVASDGNKYIVKSGAIVEEWKSRSDGKFEIGRLQFLSGDIIDSSGGGILFQSKTGSPIIYFEVSKENNIPSWSITLSSKGARDFLLSFALPDNVQPRELYWPGPTIRR